MRNTSLIPAPCSPRRHCTITVENSVVILEDSSTNGVYVNGKRVENPFDPSQRGVATVRLVRRPQGVSATVSTWRGTHAAQAAGDLVALLPPAQEQLGPSEQAPAILGTGKFNLIWKDDTLSMVRGGGG